MNQVQGESLVQHEQQDETRSHVGEITLAESTGGHRDADEPCDGHDQSAENDGTDPQLLATQECPRGVIRTDLYERGKVQCEIPCFRKDHILERGSTNPGM